MRLLLVQTDTRCSQFTHTFTCIKNFNEYNKAILDFCLIYLLRILTSLCFYSALSGKSGPISFVIASIIQFLLSFNHIWSKIVSDPDNAEVVHAVNEIGLKSRNCLFVQAVIYGESILRRYKKTDKNGFVEPNLQYETSDYAVIIKIDC